MTFIQHSIYWQKKSTNRKKKIKECPNFIKIYHEKNFFFCLSHSIWRMRNQKENSIFYRSHPRKKRKKPEWIGEKLFHFELMRCRKENQKSVIWYFFFEKSYLRFHAPSFFDMTRAIKLFFLFFSFFIHIVICIKFDILFMTLNIMLAVLSSFVYFYIIKNTKTRIKRSLKNW